MRIWQDETIIPVSIDSLDLSILEEVSSSPIGVSKLIGNVMGKTATFFPTDTFLSWRVRKLIEAGKLGWDESGDEMIQRIG